MHALELADQLDEVLRAEQTVQAVCHAMACGALPAAHWLDALGYAACQLDRETEAARTLCGQLPGGLSLREQPPPRPAAK